ncbi:MAG: adenosylcobalamin-dependent ribonucleoside-diphosphate reductase [Veillonellaceae bacterium]|jgi:ribonucleoside-diphosphate reductase alpha chain|nr:adenosylcobalamin-dependent ribonucleoside-diphosphate reductase [Veillonellaceae bacterium]
MISPEAMTLLKNRYLLEDETPDQMFWRVAEHVAQGEELYQADKNQAAEEYYKLMSNLAFLPNSPTLMNSGKANAQLAACFVLPIRDSLSDIFETLKNAVLVHHSGGGTGFSFSRLRPQGDVVRERAGKASGPLAFISIFDAVAQTVKQGAVRSGANMAVLRVDHPDIKEFIIAKHNNTELNNFNLSVGVTDSFMTAVEKDTDFALVNPRTGHPTVRVRARSIFDLIVDMAWQNGEPGLFFLDTVNRANPTPELGDFESPNPCSEQPLLPYESCTLGSINLTRMLKRGGGKWEIDFIKLAETVRTAVRFLDNVIDVNHYPLDEIKQKSLQTRKIGLGIMGLADVFIMQDMAYASQQAVRTTAKLMNFITATARQESAILASKRGNFLAFDQSIFNGKSRYMRNATVTTLAPTGSISIIANCSSGIEPLFGLAITRRVLDGSLLSSINQSVLAYLNEHKLLTPSIETMILNEGSIQSSNLSQHVKRVLATAHEIPPEGHVAQLAAAQRNIDNGVSKTVNLPQSATRSDVAHVFWQAYRKRCKGVTVYRHMSRQYQVLSHGIACPACSL